VRPASSSSGISPAPHKQIPALDGVRGLAVLLVLLDHASDAGMRLFPGADLNRLGRYGVYLFFVLSAFLLTWLPLARRSDEVTTARIWLNYFLRRFLRIFPIYALVLLTLCLIGSKMRLAEVAQHLLLRQGKAQFWSIPVEFKYYLLVPFLVLVVFGLTRRRWRIAAFAVLGAAGVCALIFLLERPWSLTNQIHLSRYMAPFLFGTVAAVVHLRLSGRARNGVLRARCFETFAVLALLLGLLLVPSIHNAIFPFAKPVKAFEWESSTCGLLWSIFLLGTLHGRGFLRAAMEWMPLRYLGFISFSAYLWHRDLLRSLTGLAAPAPLRLAAFLSLVIAVSSVTHFLVERPLSRIRLSN
jgi:peptidoglycan/LPS O-acetylase OafA/YrhL